MPPRSPRWRPALRISLRPVLLVLTAAIRLSPLAQAATRSDIEGRVLRLLEDSQARGAVVVLDVRTGAMIASVGSGRDPSAPVLPLSLIKLYAAALWWDHGMGDGSFAHSGHGRVTVHELLVQGWDRPGAEMAIRIRRRMGATRALAELERLGLGRFPGALELGGASDVEWGETLSIGERRVLVTLPEVSRFLRAIGLGGVGLLKTETAGRLQRAMREAVSRGSSRGADSSLAGTRWQLGGKTGTGPAEAAPNFDGCFAGLLFDGSRPRYTVAV
ncbi:MAG TPA: penicillin-binding transpeptidase domain-containing protein [Thermoanaerobaculia bacterium]|nr:penicillin-binding transpeptidase domain-containing protein [Thermoanaerobaculia bacterium]